MACLGSEAQTDLPTFTSGRQISARVLVGAVPYRLLDEASWATQGCAPLFRSAITIRRSKHLPVPTACLPRAEARFEARFAERTNWLGPDARRAASIAQSTRLLLSSDLVAYCG